MLLSKRGWGQESKKLFNIDSILRLILLRLTNTTNIAI